MHQEIFRGVFWREVALVGVTRTRGQAHLLFPSLYGLDMYERTCLLSVCIYLAYRQNSKCMESTEPGGLNTNLSTYQWS